MPWVPRPWLAKGLRQIHDREADQARYERQVREQRERHRQIRERKKRNERIS